MKQANFSTRWSLAFKVLLLITAACYFLWCSWPVLNLRLACPFAIANDMPALFFFLSQINGTFSRFKEIRNFVGDGSVGVGYHMYPFWTAVNPVLAMGDAPNWKMFGANGEKFPCERDEKIIPSRLLENYRKYSRTSIITWDRLNKSRIFVVGSFRLLYYRNH